MNKKGGFTLIELLAVIVILAIIAVIAVPIVLNIIDESKSNATLRSADFYLKAAELSIAQSTLKDKNIQDGEYKLKDGDICLNEVCTDKLEVEVNGEVPKTGTVTIINGNIAGVSLSYGEKEIIQNEEGKLVYVKTLNDICKPTQKQYFATNPTDLGYKYECKVDPNKDPYTFYVLSYNDEEGNIITDKTNAKSVNLIMDSNINISGESVKEGVTDDGAIFWITKEDYLKPEIGGKEETWYDYGNLEKGPITALNYLESATANWTNLRKITINKFFDNYTEYNEPEYIPEYFRVEKALPKTYNIYARLPYVDNEITNTVGEYNLYLYDNLVFKCSNLENPCGGGFPYPFQHEGLNYFVKPIIEFGEWEPIYGGSDLWISGYWVLETQHLTSAYAGSTSKLINTSNIGVRPVINLKI